jgi:hypothetical protein
MGGMLLVLALIALIYWFPVRAWYKCWGASDDELRDPGHPAAAIANGNYETTLAVTIEAGPEFVWPWLVQMGYRRGGLYSYDWLDRLFGYLDGPSADVVLPQFQQLSAGDVIPIGGSAGDFPVVAVEPRRNLVLGGEVDGFRWVWQFELVPTRPHAARLISRNRAIVPRTVGTTLVMLVLEPAAFIMTRRMLLGIKRRAERLSARAAAPAAA